MAFKRSLPTPTILWFPGASSTSFGSSIKSDLCNCLEMLCETSLKLLFDSAFTALMEHHSNSHQSFSLSLFAFKKYLYTFRLFSCNLLQTDWVVNKLFFVSCCNHVHHSFKWDHHHIQAADFADFKAEWNLLIAPSILAEFSVYNSLFKSEKLLGYCHFLLGADLFFIWNQIMLRYPMVYRINPWTTRLDAMVSFKLLQFIHILLISAGQHWAFLE